MPQQQTLAFVPKTWRLRLFKSMIIAHIAVEVSFFTVIATVVCLVTELQVANLGVGSTTLTVLGTVLGLVVAFRTSTGYERFWEGRRLWASLAVASGNITQLIWIHAKRDIDSPPGFLQAKDDILVKKRVVVKLVQAYSVAVKHHLRGEHGLLYEDLYPLLAGFPKLPLQMSASGDDLEGIPHLRPAQCPPHRTSFNWSIRSPFKWLNEKTAGKPAPDETFIEEKASPDAAQGLNVPLQIVCQLSNYAGVFSRQGYLPAHMTQAYFTNLNILQDSFAGLVRIKSTPLPVAYQFHLRVSIWLYLLFLPFQIVNAMKYVTIPAAAFASFLFLGFLEIGQIIENPFNYDVNDLDLDLLCEGIGKNIEQTIDQPITALVSFP